MAVNIIPVAYLKNNLCISNNLISMRWEHVVVTENNIYLQNDQVGDLEGEINQSDIFM